jgi:4-hydroxybenzoate polyprenyltransferase
MKFLNNANIIVSIGASFLYAETCFHLNIDWQIFELVFVFASTFFIYNINRLFALKHFKESDNERHQWIYDYRTLLWILTGFAALASAWSVLKFNTDTRVYLGILALLSLAYSVPVFGRSLRTIPGIKLILIVYVWVVVTVVIPGKLHPEVLLKYPRIYHVVLMERIFYIALLAMAFNIRDIDTDRAEGLQTIPVQLGEKIASRLSLPIGVMAIFYGIQISQEYGIVMGMIDFSVIVLVWRTPGIRKEQWFGWVMDGTMWVRYGILAAITLLYK